MKFPHEKCLSKQADFFVRRGCLLDMHLYAFCKTWSIVDHGVLFLAWCLLVSLRSLPMHIEVTF